MQDKKIMYTLTYILHFNLAAFHLKSSTLVDKSFNRLFSYALYNGGQKTHQLEFKSFKWNGECKLVGT